jgi:hypothetical protein
LSAVLGLVLGLALELAPAQDAHAELAAGRYAAALAASEALPAAERADLRTRIRWTAGDLAGALAEARHALATLPDAADQHALRYYGLQLALELRDLDRARAWHAELDAARADMQPDAAAFYGAQLPALGARLEDAAALHDAQAASRDRAAWVLALAALAALAVFAAAVRPTAAARTPR